uniref:Uncharacterized protein n=1 Tax=Aegilops tauschii subsp. strangulata TaxID=200361 RepID=A0A453C997_AEGTS
FTDIDIPTEYSSNHGRLRLAMEPMLAEVRAANEDMLYSLYFPAGGRAPTAAAVDCVCLDYLSCRECECILGDSFLAIELAVLKKQRIDHTSIPAARVQLQIGHVAEGSRTAVSGMSSEQLVPGSHLPSDGVESSDVAAGMADRLVPGSDQPSDGVRGSDAAISSMAVRLGPVSHPTPSHGIKGFEEAISDMAARLGLAATIGERAKEVFKKMDDAKAWPRSLGRSRGPLAYAACLSIACRADG